MRKMHSLQYRACQRIPDEGLTVPFEGLDGLSVVSLEEEIRTAAGGAQARGRLRLVRLHRGSSAAVRQRRVRAGLLSRERVAVLGAPPPVVREQEVSSGRASQHVKSCKPDDGKNPPAEPGEVQGRSVKQTAPPQPGHVAPQADAYRKLFPDPGLRLVLPDRIFRQEEGLSPTGIRSRGATAECRVQVYVVLRLMAASRLAAAELGAAKRHRELRPLTRDKARMLGLGRLYRPCSHPFETEASTRQIYPGQRLYRILFGAAGPEVKSAPRQELGEQAGTPEAIQLQPPGQPEPFQYSREDAIREMNSLLGTLPPRGNSAFNWLVVRPLRLLKTLFTILSAAGRVRRWRRRLAGKDLHQQLWGVAPPRGFTFHPGVRRWAAENLSRRGPQDRQLLQEWEIFWRRRGWR